MKRILPSAFYNPLSMAGAAIATINLGLVAFLTAVMIYTKHAGPYADIIVYFALPLIAFGGLVLMAVGAWRERRRRKHGMPERRLPVLDRNDPRQRMTMAAIGAMAGGWCSCTRSRATRPMSIPSPRSSAA